MTAATRVIALRGLGAATAAIAKEAGVSNGSLFLYFDTKVALFNELFVALKSEMGETAVAGLPEDQAPRQQVRHMWAQWLDWATTNPEKRRALAQLEVAEEISEESHRTGRQALHGTAELLDRCRADGALAEVPLSYVTVLIGAMADSTMDAMIRKPEEAEARSEVAFEAVWRVLAG